MDLSRRRFLAAVVAAPAMGTVPAALPKVVVIDVPGPQFLRGVSNLSFLTLGESTWLDALDAVGGWTRWGTLADESEPCLLPEAGNRG